MRVEQLALGDPGDEVLGERVAVERVEGVAQRVDRHRPVDPLVEDPVQDVAAGLGHLERAPQQVGEQVHGDALLAQHLGEAVVLLLGAVHPQHVVEQQPVLVARGQAQHLGAGAVQDHLAQAPDLGVDPERSGRDGGGTGHRAIPPPAAAGGEMRGVRLDPVDEKIITLLVEDARRSFADIGGRVGLTASAVKRRVDRLRAGGAIGGFTVRLEPEALGWTVEGYVELYCRNSTSPQAIRTAIARFPEIVDASTISGEADALLRIVAADMHHFERVLEQIGAQPFVARTKSVLVLSALLRRPVTPRHDDALIPLRVTPQCYATNRASDGSICAMNAPNRQRMRIVRASSLAYRGVAGPRRRGRPFDPSEERPMTAVVPDPVAVGARTPVRTATPRHYLMCPPAHFAVEYAINPWMLPGTAVDRRPGPRAVGRAAPHLPRPGAPRRPARAGAGPARHGLRGQRRHRRRRHRARRPVPPPAARGRGRRPRHVVPPGRGPRRRAGVRQRGRGRPARRRLGPAP